MYDWEYCEFQIIDCKKRTKPIDIKDVEQFIGLVADTGANKGTIISSSGFTVGAKKRAKIEDNIRLRKLTWEDAYNSISGEIYPTYMAKMWILYN